MTRDQVFAIVKGHICEVLPEVPEQEIALHRSLSELGANSVDRMEVVTLSLESLDLRIPLMSFAGVSDIQGLVDVLAQHAAA